VALPVTQLFSCALVEPDLRNGGRTHSVYFFSSEEGALNRKTGFVNGWLKHLVPYDDDDFLAHCWGSKDEPKAKKAKKVKHDPSSREFFGTTSDGDRIQAVVTEVKVNMDASSAEPLISLTTFI